MLHSAYPGGQRRQYSRYQCGHYVEPINAGMTTLPVTLVNFNAQAAGGTAQAECR
jgi:hypothetical protein